MLLFAFRELHESSIESLSVSHFRYKWMSVGRYDSSSGWAVADLSTRNGGVAISLSYRFRKAAMGEIGNWE